MLWLYAKQLTDRNLCDYSIVNAIVLTLLTGIWHTMFIINACIIIPLLRCFLPETSLRPAMRSCPPPAPVLLPASHLITWMYLMQVDVVNENALSTYTHSRKPPRARFQTRDFHLHTFKETFAGKISNSQSRSKFQTYSLAWNEMWEGGLCHVSFLNWNEKCPPYKRIRRKTWSVS